MPWQIIEFGEHFIAWISGTNLTVTTMSDDPASCAVYKGSVEIGAYACETAMVVAEAVAGVL